MVPMELFLCLPPHLLSVPQPRLCPPVVTLATVSHNPNSHNRRRGRRRGRGGRGGGGGVSSGGCGLQRGLRGGGLGQRGEEELRVQGQDGVELGDGLEKIIKMNNSFCTFESKNQQCPEINAGVKTGEKQMNANSCFFSADQNVFSAYPHSFLPPDPVHRRLSRRLELLKRGSHSSDGDLQHFGGAASNSSSSSDDDGVCRGGWRRGLGAGQG